MKVPILSIIKYCPEAVISRPFPHKGEILVKVGATVMPITHLAAAKVSFLNQTLSFSGRLKVKENDWVKGGQLLSTAGFFNGDDLVAPFAGIINKIDEKRYQVTLASPPRDFFLVAGCKGVVSQIIDDTEIKIQSPATVVRGVIGVHSGSGELILDSQMKEEESIGKVILTNFLNLVLLTKAKTLGVAGIITAGLDWETFLAVRGDKSLGLLVIEGFGGMTGPNHESAAVKFLEQQLGKFVAINGASLEALIPGVSLNNSSSSLPLMTDLTVGACVKIFGWPHFNAVGTVVEILSNDYTFDSELTAPAAKVKLSSTGKEVIVPIETLGLLV